METIVTIDKEKVNWAREVIASKRELWESRFPNLEFDENGRAFVGLLPGYNQKTFNKEIGTKNATVFNKCLKEACTELRIETISLKDLTYEDFCSRRITVTTKNGNVQERSLPSILARANLIWERKMPLHRPLRNLYKTMVKENNTSDDVEIIRGILDRMEQNNTYMSYDKLMRLFQSKKIFISINPLDKLFSSGGSDSDSITRFSSCWANDMTILSDNSVEISPLGSYANPIAQIKLGEHALCGMLIVPNDNELDVFGMKFLGMLQRSHIWLKEDSIFIENIYPDKHSREIRDTVTRVINPFVSVYEPSDTERLKNPPGFDSASWAAEFFDCEDKGNSVYLDKVRISKKGRISILL